MALGCGERARVALAIGGSGMSPRTKVEQTTATPPPYSRALWHVLMSAARGYLRELIHHGEPALWARRAVGAILVAFGLAVLVSGLAGGR
jgi:hypothetical protein